MGGQLAISRSGHDKGRVYVILKEEADNVYLADGKIRFREKPKKKNKKHIQVIKRLPENVMELLPQDREFGNEEIKRAIKLYQKASDEEVSACQKQM